MILDSWNETDLAILENSFDVISHFFLSVLLRITAVLFI